MPFGDDGSHVAAPYDAIEFRGNAQADVATMPRPASRNWRQHRVRPGRNRRHTIRAILVATLS
jgi:hypothetical protein